MATSSISGWGEGIILSIVFVSILVGIISSMNIIYGKSYSLNLDSEMNDTTTLFVEKVKIGQNETLSGEGLTTAYGVQPKNSLGIVRDFISIIWQFINGNWITKVAEMIGGEAIMTLAVYLRVLFVMSLIFGVLYAIFKVVI